VKVKVDARSIRNVQAEGGRILTTVVVPKSGGVTSTKANVVRWLKREGDTVREGEALVELETEKVSFELESPVAGILLKVLAKQATVCRNHSICEELPCQT